MGKGRWQHGAANCNHTEPNGQQPEPETQHELSEPCALQGARTVHRGGKCREAPTYLNCFCESREDAEQVQRILVEWLKERGLTLSEEKTRIVHLTEGFDFLGFNVRHYPAPQTARTGWKLLIKPELCIHPRRADETQRALAKGTRNQCPNSRRTAQSGHPR